jgi:hypothetical protein
MAKKSVVEVNYTNYRRRSKASPIAVSTQWDSRDSVPTGRETVTIRSSHTTTTEYQTHTRLRTIFQPSSSAVLFAISYLSEAFSPETPRWLCRLCFSPMARKSVVEFYDTDKGRRSMGFQRFCTHRSSKYHHQFSAQNDC